MEEVLGGAHRIEKLRKDCPAKQSNDLNLPLGIRKPHLTFLISNVGQIEMDHDLQESRLWKVNVP